MNKLLMVFAASMLLGDVAMADTGLYLTGGKPVVYQCEGGKKITAHYYNLSDSSLGLVKFHWEGQDYTLPSAVSGSGARYSDYFTAEWWERGGVATLDLNITDKQSKTVECNEV